MARKKGGGGKLSRSEIIQARLDPRLHSAAELMARMERRTLSSFIERSIEQMGKTQKVKRNLFNSWMSPNYEIFNRDQLYSRWDEVTVEQAVQDIDANHEAIKFFKFASYFPALLTHEEEELFRSIISIPYFWMYYPVNTEDHSGKIVHTAWLQVNAFEGLVQENLIEYWDVLKTNQADFEYLESLPTGKEIPAPLKQDLTAIKKFIHTKNRDYPSKVIYAWKRNSSIKILQNDPFWEKNSKNMVTKHSELLQTDAGLEVVTTYSVSIHKEEQNQWVQFYKKNMEEINNDD